MQRLTFINALGREITFDNYAPYVFWKITGLELPPVLPISTQASGQHGYTLHELLLDERVVRLSCHVHGPSGKQYMYQKRRELNAVCNPLLGMGKLIYANDHGTWRTDAFCKADTYGTKIQNIQTLDVTFECPGAFWMSAEPMAFSLGFIEGGLIWPLETPNYWGTVGYLANVYNDGDVAAPFEMYINGGSVNPVVTNVTTGDFIKVEKNIETYERLYINTDPENLTVSLITVNTETNEPELFNAYSYLSADSELFLFAPGLNELTFHTDDDNQDVTIRGTYYKRFVGV